MLCSNLAVPESPRKVFEAAAVLEGFLALCEHWVCSVSRGRDEKGNYSRAQRPERASSPSSSRTTSAATESTGKGRAAIMGATWARIKVQVW